MLLQWRRKEDLLRRRREAANLSRIEEVLIESRFSDEVRGECRTIGVVERLADLR